jgi:hypothetical protein
VSWRGGGSPPWEGGPAAGVCVRRALAGSGVYGGQPAVRPIRDGSEDRFQCMTTRSQPIAHSHGRTRIDKTLNEPFCLELTQSLRENSITDAGDAREELIEASRRWQQCFHDRPGPTLPYQLDGALKGRAVVEAPTDHGERFYALSVVSEATLDFYFNDFFDTALDHLVPDQPWRSHGGRFDRARAHCGDYATLVRPSYGDGKSQNTSTERARSVRAQPCLQASAIQYSGRRLRL